MSKIYKSVDEQIKYLKENKKIIVRDEHRQIFEERNYSSLINPYKEFFSYGRDDAGNHIYRKEIDFEEILKIIKVDEDFCTTMYSYIGAFEKKFKSILFAEICSKYVKCSNDKQDLECISYIDEINDFLSSDDDYDKLPRFCPNYPFTLSKNGFVEDMYDIEKKKNLLKHLKEIGTGVTEDGKDVEKNNKLIDHYLKKQKIAPLWVVPNALTLGELKVLYSMLDSSSQKRIAAKFYNKKEPEKLSTGKLLSFSGAIELIRRIRNVVNHYEPIFPLLTSEMKPIKKIKESQIYAVFKLLEETFVLSPFNNVTHLDLKIEVNNFNSKYVKILNAMKEFTNGQNKK